MKVNRLREPGADKVFNWVNIIFLSFCTTTVVAPLLNVIAQSFSSPNAVITGIVKFWPVEFSTAAYRMVMTSKFLLTAYKNSIVYTFVGTMFNIIFTVLAAYPLSRPDFIGRAIITKLFIFTMIFSAPLIPVYLNVRSLHMLDTIWAVTVPGAINVYNMIIARTFFQHTIPDEMIKAAELDGASDIQILLRLVLPLSKAVLAVLVLFYAVGHWNSYFDAMIYFQNQAKFPLQVALREILASSKNLEEMANVSAEQAMLFGVVEVMKYAVIVFGSLPVICLYPVVQKYFVTGVMIGSLKG
jgi:ABC-type glycerol-3-phosphate transport system permease component